MNILDAIRARRSVRAFDGTPLSADERAALLKTIAEASSPFAPASAVTITLADFDIKGPYRPSTYGTITDAPSYLLMGFGRTDDARLAAGFTLEQIVLRATELGLGTCWIAATFKGTDFEKKADFPAGQKLDIVCPVGHPVDRRSFRDRLTRLIAGSDKRRPFGDLFFSGDFHTPLSPENTFAESLEMMRLAPSSMNCQPWRALVDNDGTVHFYHNAKSKMPLLDCGIGLAHFALAEQAQGILPGLFYTEPNPPASPADLSYIRSYRRP